MLNLLCYLYAFILIHFDGIILLGYLLSDRQNGDPNFFVVHSAHTKTPTYQALNIRRYV